MSAWVGLRRTLALTCLLASASCRRESSRRQGQAPASTSPSPPAATPVDASPTLGPSPSEPEIAARRPSPRSDATEPARSVELVTIKLAVIPPKVAHVFWGVKDLGVAPLELHRARGSGPMDIVLRAPGFLAHHTRLFTDRDDTLAIRMGPENEASRYFGYQAPVEKTASTSKTKPGNKPAR